MIHPSMSPRKNNCPGITLLGMVTTFIITFLWVLVCFDPKYSDPSYFSGAASKWSYLAISIASNFALFNEWRNAIVYKKYLEEEELKEEFAYLYISSQQKHRINQEVARKYRVVIATILFSVFAVATIVQFVYANCPIEESRFLYASTTTSGVYLLAELLFGRKG